MNLIIDKLELFRSERPMGELECYVRLCSLAAPDGRIHHQIYRMMDWAGWKRSKMRSFLDYLIANGLLIQDGKDFIIPGREAKVKYKKSRPKGGDYLRDTPVDLKDVTVSEPLRLAKYMHTRLTQQFPQNLKVRNAKTEIWEYDCKLIIVNDERGLRQAAEVFKWAMADDFWFNKIDTPIRLRKHFDTLIAQMQAKTPQATTITPKQAMSYE